MGSPLGCDFTCIAGGLTMSFLLTDCSQLASKLFLTNRCERMSQTVRYKKMRLLSPVSTLTSEAGGPHGRSTR